MTNILEIARECPGTIISIRVEDLIAANETLLIKARQQEIELANAKARETLMSAEDVAKKLDVSLTTLWRWQKRGYLVPLYVGGQMRYRSADVNAIMEGKQ